MDVLNQNEKENKISVIVPIYNAIPFLSECIDSILSQTYQNLELILIDDGSTDSSSDVCRAFSIQDPRIKYIYQQNAGASSARNLGLNLASGEWIAFVDADDILDKRYFEILLKNAFLNNADITFGISNLIDENGMRINQNITTDVHVQSFTSYEALFHLIKADKFGCGINKIFRSELCKNLRFDESIHYTEDLLFNFQLFNSASIIVYTNQQLYNYRQHSSSMSKTAFNADYYDKFLVLDILLQTISSNTNSGKLFGILVSRYWGTFLSLFIQATSHRLGSMKFNLIETARPHKATIRKGSELPFYKKIFLLVFFLFHR